MGCHIGPYQVCPPCTHSWPRSSAARTLGLLLDETQIGQTSGLALGEPPTPDSSNNTGWGRECAYPKLDHMKRRLQIFRVRGQSMTPTLIEGDLVICSHGTPTIGQLVICELSADRPLSVKRVVARHDDGWWVERDNRREGIDSWHVGAIPDAKIKAVVRWHIAGWPRLRRFASKLAS